MRSSTRSIWPQLFCALASGAASVSAFLLVGCVSENLPNFVGLRVTDDLNDSVAGDTAGRSCGSGPSCEATQNPASHSLGAYRSPARACTWLTAVRARAGVRTARDLASLHLHISLSYELARVSVQSTP